MTPPAMRSRSFFFSLYGDHRDLHSFPTRRSSDLSTMRRFAVIAIWAALASALAAQAPAPGTARAISPVDLTGNWVSIVTEDWRFRMVTPPPKDYASVPLNGAARAVADKWDPAADEAAGNACKSYGAGNIMRVPGRLHISWQDDTTLKIETDAGQQTRLLHFTGTPGGEPSWQGYSQASWEIAGGAPFGGGGRGGAGGGGGGGGAGGAAGGGRPEVPGADIHHEHALQEGARRVEVVSSTL